MLKKGLIPFLLVMIITFYCEAKIKYYDEVVSLGFSCQVAHQLDQNGVRTTAYPFDWLLTPYEGLLTFITQKGKDFFNLDKISVLGPYPGDPGHLHIVDTIYNTVSLHDFLTSPPMGNYTEVKAKYDRRIKRFFDLLNSKKRVLFIRHGLAKSEIEYLDHILKQFYPNLRYTLVAINDTQEYSHPWKLSRIENYYMKPTTDWRGDYIRWKEILSQYIINNHFLLPAE